MSVVPRPIDTVTETHIQLGMPFVEFAPRLSGGGFAPYRDLGIPDSAAVAKTLEVLELRDSRSGISQLVREIVRRIDARIRVATFAFTPENMQLIFGAASINVVSGGVLTETNDPFLLTDDDQDFVDLLRQSIVEPITTVECDTITDEEVGTGEGGAFGETTGDFALDFKPLVIGDITEFLHITSAGVETDRTTDLVAGSAPTAGQIGIEVGATATSGQITYPAGEAPASGTRVVATYRPTHSFAEATTASAGDFVVDYKQGRVRFFALDGATDALRSFQPMRATYDYNAVDRAEINPLTQLQTEGRMRLRLLSDVGVNIIWPVPKAAVRLTDDDFEFSRENPGLANLVVTLLDNGGAAPYGTMQIHEEQ